MHHDTQTEKINHNFISSPDKRRDLQARKPALVNGCVHEHGDQIYEGLQSRRAESGEGAICQMSQGSRQL